jgi:sugar phosphate permease
MWRTIVIVTLLTLYTGYYFNRSNISVATPNILEDTGLNKTEFGTVLRFASHQKRKEKRAH